MHHRHKAGNHFYPLRKVNPPYMAAMHLDRYRIVPAGDHWAVRRNADVVRIFRQRTDAIRAAIEAAQVSQERGNTAEVLTESWDGEIVPLFTFAGHARPDGLTSP